MRTMRHEFEGRVFYESRFDPSTGLLVRVTETSTKGRYHWDRHVVDALFPGHRRRYAEDGPRERWEKRFGWRREAFSPSPETVDISITDWCGFGCPYCYMDSRPDRKHAPASLVSDVIRAFAIPPYQIAIGGGEPMAHPDLPDILRSARDLGTVPNYTTAGHIFRPEVIEATNRVCGGVSMTYHAFKGLDWFVAHYRRLRQALTVQMNVHLIADKDVATNLDALRGVQDQTGMLSIILLAYYPNVGRAGLLGIMPKRVYQHELPAAIKRAIGGGMKIAFSEGLLPYFISRPDLGVDTTYAERSEGRFSCYVNPDGELFKSSFHDDRRADRLATIRLPGAARKRSLTLQEQWDKFPLWDEPCGAQCHDCAEQVRCATPSIHHYLACAYADHNGGSPPLTRAALNTEED